MAISEPTAVFSIRDDKDQEIKQVMQLVYGALEEKGYNRALRRYNRPMPGGVSV